MKVAILCSEKNEASLNMRDRLLENHGFVENKLRIGTKELEIFTFSEQLLFLENIDKKISADLFIFPSTHTSKANIDALTVHVPGNWGNADFGGKNTQVCIAEASLMKIAFRKLWTNPFGIQTILEATHHGPFIEKPAMFIEIGSSSEKYRDEKIGEFVASVIIQGLKELGNSKFKSAVGIGGLHHCPNFGKVMLGNEIAIGHVMPKHHLANIDSSLLLKAAEKTIPRAGIAIVDWKGLGEHKDNVRKSVEESGLKFARTSDF